MPIDVRPARLADALGIAVAHHAAVHAALPGVYGRIVRGNWAPPVDLARAERHAGRLHAQKALAAAA